MPLHSDSSRKVTGSRTLAAMLALSAIFAVVISSVTISHDQAFADSHTTVTLAGPTANPVEGTPADITVSLSGATTTDVVVPLKITPGTAAVTSDYTVPDPSTVTITSTSTNNAETFSVPTVNDAVYEPQQTFTVSLDTQNANWPTGFSAGTPSSVTITIDDDDSTAPTGSVVIRVKNADGTYADLDSSDPPQQDTTFVPSSGHVLHADTADATTPIYDADNDGNSDGDLADDGDTALTFNYQWIRTNDGSTTADDADEAIAGATSSTYALTDEDVGDLITVQVWASDRLDGGNGNSSAAVVDTAPDPDVTVIAAGTNGYELGRPAPRGAVDYDEARPFIIAGALPENTRPRLGFIQLVPDVILTANTSGMFKENSSNEQQLVDSNGDFVIVDLNGDGTVDDNVLLANVTFAWHRDGKAFKSLDCGATTTDTTPEPCEFTGSGTGDDDTKYTLTDDDVAKTITLAATYTTRSAVGNVGDANYEPPVVSAANLYRSDSAGTAQRVLDGTLITVPGRIRSTNPSEGAPAITGKAQVGETLTANRGSMKDKDGAPAGQDYFIPEEKDIRYIWFYGEDWDRVFRENTPATRLHIGSTYALGAKDAGKTLIVRGGFFDRLGDYEVNTSDRTNTVASSPGMISKIEPGIRGVVVSGGDSVKLEVEVYGLQGKMDQSLADGITLTWSVEPSSGSLPAAAAGNSMVTYTAPTSPGTYTVTAMVSDGDCQPDEEAMRETACSASFDVRVRRSAPTQPEPAAPANPPGDIPTILTDSAGNQYEVFTPVEGGTFDAGEGYLIVAPSGAVPNGEFIGVRMSDDGSASNAGMTHQRYTLGGNMYGVHVVNSDGGSVSDYPLEEAAKVCVPLPDMFRARISDLALVTINNDGSLTILAANVRLGNDGSASVCGNLSELPASVAVGSMGAPDAIPTATPVPTPVPPPTGATAPTSSGMVLWTLLLGTAAAALGLSLLLTAGHRRRRQTTNH